MAKKKLQHVNRQLTEKERERHAQIREDAMKDFPPKGTRRKLSPPEWPAGPFCYLDRPDDFGYCL